MSKREDVNEAEKEKRKNAPNYKCRKVISDLGVLCQVERGKEKSKTSPHTRVSTASHASKSITIALQVSALNVPFMSQQLE